MVRGRMINVAAVCDLFFCQELPHCRHFLCLSVNNCGTFHIPVSSVVLLPLPGLICTRYPLHLQPSWWLSASCHTPATSSFTFFQHSQNLNFSHCDACLLAIFALFWCTCNGHTLLFLREFSPRTVSQACSTLPLPIHAHEGYRQHTIQHCCHIMTCWSSRPTFLELYYTTMYSNILLTVVYSSEILCLPVKDEHSMSKNRVRRRI